MVENKISFSILGVRLTAGITLVYIDSTFGDAVNFLNN